MFRNVLREKSMAVINTFQWERRPLPALERPDRDRLHCCARRRATAVGPVSGPGQNWNPTATGKEHTKARPPSRNSSCSKMFKAGKSERRASMVS